MSQPTAVDRFLAAVRDATIDSCDAWAPDATLDATVPEWRFHKRGADEIRATYRGWFADPGRLEQLRRHPIEGGEVVEYLLTWTEAGVPHAGHHVHLLDVVDDRIVRDVVMCGGRWPASLLAEMEAADA
ncbi:hypothetical protein HNR19_003326 [Nocardioides thalensis]|uniref:SnoaL-like domain-containing protein n=1 Tax=Nocardioides thalensis TaxID=1914755 RepID=A0A853C836_9ACTN|nr:nuclear transport factor 2 family protein [Nocardioides thalensis]NYJ02628.1 hypothetical protein [Nocardioides thalensis]